MNGLLSPLQGCMSLFCSQSQHQRAGLSFLEKSTLYLTLLPATPMPPRPRAGGGGGQQGTYSSMNTRDRNTLNRHIKWIYIIYIIYSSSTVCTNTRMWLFYVVWMLLYSSQVYIIIIIALWLHIFSKLVSLVVFRCTEHKVVSELIQLENSCRRGGSVMAGHNAGLILYLEILRRLKVIQMYFFGQLNKLRYSSFFLCCTYCEGKNLHNSRFSFLKRQRTRLLSTVLFRRDISAEGETNLACITEPAS